MLTSWLATPVWVIYAMLFVVGTARIFYSTAVASIVPHLVPREQFDNANAWVSSSSRTAAIVGPALGGAIIAGTETATWAYVAALAANLIFVVGATRLPPIRPAGAHQRRSVSDLFAGFRFIRRTPIFLAAITLDMFAVLLGGAVVLMPIFAKDILQVGPQGLGWLRAAPALGSLCMLLALTRFRPWKRPGITLLVTVAGFGLASIAFGLSRNFALSLFCLALTGAFDSVSVVIRSTLEQVITPDRLRGRVGAISYVFVGFSNEFGAFESGITAALFGTVVSVVGGGIGTILVVIAVGAVWPALSRIGPLHTLKPNEIEEAEAEVRHAV
jgi:MFS family permease